MRHLFGWKKVLSKVAKSSDSDDIVTNESPAKARSTDSVLVVTIPKSGTVYMNAMFSGGLGLENYILSNRYFPVDQLNLDAMAEFAKGGYIASTHIDPSPENMQILARYIQKWFVHFRDPRSVMLSWVHHIDQLHQDGRYDDMLRVFPVPPRQLHQWSLTDRIQWHIEHFLPHVIRWMTDWITVIEQNPERILVTEFGALKENEEEHLGRVLDFLGIDRAIYTHRPPVKTMASHFRTGTYDEWRTSFTSQQISEASGMIPHNLFQRFNWPRL